MNNMLSAVITAVFAGNFSYHHSQKDDIGTIQLSMGQLSQIAETVDEGDLFDGSWEGFFKRYKICGEIITFRYEQNIPEIICEISSKNRVLFDFSERLEL